MKPHSVKDIEKALLKKGFQNTSSSHHHQYHFIYKGKFSGIHTYLSHGAKSIDYEPNLMNSIKRQLKFKD